MPDRPTNPIAPPTPIAPAREPEARVSTVLGDRLCIRCGFNLYGQPILRESVYGMFIVRCPECATIAAVQEYPSLGKWSRRWAAILAALWVVLLLALSFGGAGVLFGLSVAVPDIASEPLWRTIEARHEAWATEQERLREEATVDPDSPPTVTSTVITTPGGVIRYPGQTTTGSEQWWDSQDKAALLRESGGYIGAMRHAAGFLVPLVLIPAAIGIVLGVALLHLRGVRLAVAALFPVLIASAFWAIRILAFGSNRNWGFVLWGKAQEIIEPVLGPAALGLEALAIVSGALLGRRVARLAVRAFVPPRQRIAFSPLWLCDNLPPPDARVRPRRAP